MTMAKKMPLAMTMNRYAKTSTLHTKSGKERDGMRKNNSNVIRDAFCMGRGNRQWAHTHSQRNYLAQHPKALPSKDMRAISAKNH